MTDESTDLDDENVSGPDGDVDSDTAGSDDDIDHDVISDDVITDAQAAMEESRQRLAEVPADVVVTNHVMGLYELAAIHLSASPPSLASAALAIDAMACLVDGLGDRLGELTPTMRDALGNIRLAFVQVKAAASATVPDVDEASGSAPDGDAAT